MMRTLGGYPIRPENKAVPHLWVLGALALCFLQAAL